MKAFLLRYREGDPIGVVMANNVEEVATKIRGEVVKGTTMIAISRECFSELPKDNPYAPYCLGYRVEELYFTILREDDVLMVSTEEVPVLY